METSNNSNKLKDMSQIDNDLKRYAAILGYLQYENTVYWQRSHVILVANAALLGFILTNIPLSTCAHWTRLLTIGIPSIGGLILSLFWLCLLRKGEFWINRWHSILIKLEPSAFESIEVIRNAYKDEDKDKGLPIKKIARLTSWLFIGLWLFVIIYIFTISILKVFISIVKIWG